MKAKLRYQLRKAWDTLNKKKSYQVWGVLDTKTKQMIPFPLEMKHSAADLCDDFNLGKRDDWSNWGVWNKGEYKLV